MWWRSHAPKARISPAALLRGYASATERPKGRQCAKGSEASVQRRAVASRAAMSNSPGRSGTKDRAGGGNGAHERGAPPPVAPEGGAGLGIEVDQGGRAASALEIGGHMDGQGGLAGAALLGYQCDGVHCVRNPAESIPDAAAWLGARRLPRSHTAAMPRSRRQPAGPLGQVCRHGRLLRNGSS